MVKVTGVGDGSAPASAPQLRGTAIHMRSRAAIALAGLLLSSAVFGFLFDAVAPLFATLMLTWLVAGIRRLDLLIIVSLLIIGVLWVVIVSGMLAIAVGVSLIDVLVFVCVLVGGVGILTVRFAEAGKGKAGPSILSLSTWIASTSGAVVLTAALLVSLMLTPDERLGWVMRNDSLNNLMFARTIMCDDGIVVGGAENPAPLPAVLIALGALAGRSTLSTDALLRHDLDAMGSVWALLIGLTCIMAGLTVATVAVAMGARTIPATIGSGLGSLLVLSWMVTGYPMQYGFFNTHVVLPVILAMVVLALRARDAPTAALVGLLFSATVMLAVWAPLVVVPAVLLVMGAMRDRRSVWPAASASRVAVVVGVVQLLAYGLAVTVPIYVEQRPALSGLGGIFDFTSVLIPVVGVILLLMAISWRRGASAASTVPTVASLLAATLAGLAFLLFLNRNAVVIWSYYPIKFSWLMLIVLVIVGIGMLVGLTSTFGSARMRALLMGAASGVVIAALVWTPFIGPAVPAMNAVHRIVLGHVVDPAGEFPAGVLANYEQDTLTLLWESGEPAESEINVWLVLLYIGSLDEKTDLRILSLQAFSDRSVAMLCAISDVAADDVVVVTASSSLRSEVQATCPDRASAIEFRAST